MSEAFSFNSPRLQFPVMEAHFQPACCPVNQLPLTRQTPFRQFRPVNSIKLLQKSDHNISRLRECKLLADTNPRPSIEWQIIEAWSDLFPAFRDEVLSVRAPNFWISVEGPKLAKIDS